ncbi:hypothetical protein BDDG_03368 [Blastomyces dermatitidis ATCC 18188]|uniref:Uncharacterized protein n=1 Tax=Ajellomyces dermatitidis (strain ATCC 18188 / CBS 674.68) TaxID=653446 RepID=F2TB14_AJEDA|nr:hypothetical protein BDDG_03368 [Blastomyces dermatitidis ATCC 18188]
MEEKLQIELLRVTVSETKLSSGFSLNDHTGSYITVLTEEKGSVITAAERVRDRSDTDELISRRDDISLQGTATIITAIKEAEEEEDVTMKAVLSWLIDATVSTFNLAFLTATEATTASQRHLLFTRKCQNKPLIILQE